MSETNENKEAVAVGSDSNEGLGVRWWKVFFKGGDEDRPHEEVFGVKAEDLEHARIEAFRQMREEFHIRYPEIYRIEFNRDA